ncbi:SDR family oxidoreductase [Patulibacter defluvii]|uniref:SDR family oxidoreductase n=1 Tax=Patulibacter defluvii TaxID=3095358 RepID=UPI002A75152E|nr:NAD(P)H-binding protein [Patulibacter sp. DM4]
MQLAVIGGTGTIGGPVVEALAARGDEVRVLSRTAPAAPVAGSRHQRVDLTDGAGLREALDGVDAVVDASDDRSIRQRHRGPATARVLEAAADAGVGHLVGISIVGCDRSPLAYHRANAAQEQQQLAGPVPVSIQRLTQVHPLLDTVMASSARFGLSPRARFPLQPIDPRDAAVAVVAAIDAGPSGRRPDVGGPLVQPLAELAEEWAAIRGRRRITVPVPTWGAGGRAVRDGLLCAPDGPVDGRTFAAWLEAAR